MTDNQPTLDRYSVQEVAERLGVGATTIKTWATTLGIEGQRNASGKRYFTPDHLRILETVKALRDQDAGMETITRVVGQVSDTQRTTDGHPSDTRPTTDHEPTPVDLLPVVQELNRTVQEVNRLALLLTQAGQENERLRGEVLQAERKLIEAEGKAKTQEGETDRLKLQQAKQDQEIASLCQQLEVEKAKPWWRKLIGR
jgi:DNA-binding transcriptional MerR regulator